MENLNQDIEILEKVAVLHNKFKLTLEGAVVSYVTPTEEQRVRLIEQLEDITTRTNRFIKNLILLLESSR